MEPALRNRLTLGPIMLIVLAGTLWLDWVIQKKTVDDQPNGISGVTFTIFLLVIVPLAVRELSRLFAAEQVKPYRLISTIASSLIILHGFATQFAPFQKIAASSMVFIIVGTMLAAAYQRVRIKDSQQAIVGMAGTLLATMYVGGLAWFMIALRVKDGDWYTGTIWHVVMLLLCCKFTDIGAFFVGRAFGKRKLIAWLSPGKTWEGLIGGLVLAGIVGALCATQLSQMIWYNGIWLGIIIGFVGQLGDLFESMMKRDAEVKDSGRMIPGFGGVLDVIDSPLLAAPVAYLLFSLAA
jgi:phosphatidate cytidylyltransferase